MNSALSKRKFGRIDLAGLLGIAVLAAMALGKFGEHGVVAVAADPPAEPASAPPPPPPAGGREFLPQPSPPEQRILTELEQPTTCDFNETPLSDVLDYLRSRHNMQIVADIKALQDAGMGPDSPVTCRVSGVKLGSALRLLLASLELKFFVDDDVLQVTTRDVADGNLKTLTYPVGDLVAKGDYDSLIEAITSTVSPQTWDEVGGPGVISEVRNCSSVVISQTFDVHEEIVTLLRALREAKMIAGGARPR